MSGFGYSGGGAGGGSSVDQTDIDAAVAALVASAPSSLNTLKELADALGDDASYAATITTALAGKQPLDATLTAFAALAIASGKLPYGSGTDAFSLADLTAAGRALLDDADAAAQRTTLGLGSAALLASTALPGTELDYVAFSAPVSITATDEGSANVVVTGTSKAYAAVPIEIEFFAPAIAIQPTASAGAFVVLFDGATPIGMLAGPRTPAAAANRFPCTGKIRLTPTAATHQYIVKVWTSSGTSTVEAGVGGTGDYVNGYLRVKLV